MQEFLLILKGDGMNHLSPAELQDIMSDYQTWVSSMGEHYLGGQKLDEVGALLTSKSDKVLTDGPFLESKEIIAGFFLIQADSMEDAIRITQTSPHLGLYQIEVRPISFPKMK